MITHFPLQLPQIVGWLIIDVKVTKIYVSQLSLGVNCFRKILESQIGLCS